MDVRLAFGHDSEADAATSYVNIVLGMARGIAHLHSNKVYSNKAVVPVSQFGFAFIMPAL